MVDAKDAKQALDNVEGPFLRVKAAVKDYASRGKPDSKHILINWKEKASLKRDLSDLVASAKKLKKYCKKIF